MKLKYKPIGFFDSGVGGISVLKEALNVLPSEDYIYFGDSINAPYGVKRIDEVKALTFNAVDLLVKKDVKAVVIACNTATSAAIDDLRDAYNIPVIGIEPALKPAVELHREGKIIIMATPMTLAETKFNNLMKNYSSIADIQPMPCPGLVEMIEKGIVCGEAINTYLHHKLEPYNSGEIAAVVLGCTHYPFIIEELSKVLNCNIPIIDGSSGTVNQLKRQLEKYDLVNDKHTQGSVDIINSLNTTDVINLSYKLLKNS